MTENTPAIAFQSPLEIPPSNTETLAAASLTGTSFTEATEVAIPAAGFANAPSVSTPDSPFYLDDFQLRKIPSLETPNFLAPDGILTIDESITRYWPRGSVLSVNGRMVESSNNLEAANLLSTNSSPTTNRINSNSTNSSTNQQLSSQLEKSDSGSKISGRTNSQADNITSNQQLNSKLEESSSGLATNKIDNGSQYNFVLGYSSFNDEIFTPTDVGETVWRIEQARNQEFKEHLGVKENYPNLKRMHVEGIQETLRNVEKETKKRSVIIYILARINQLELVLVPALGKPIRYSITEANKAVLSPIVKEFRDEITNARKRGTRSYQASAQKLYEWMIKPLEKDLKSLNIETLLLSVDPGLRSMPFAALHDGNQFLIEKYSLSLIPSFSLMDTHYASLKDASVLAMGASEFTDKNPLPAVPIELKSIVSEWQGKSFLNTDFTLNNLRSQRLVQSSRIVHLATHSEFNPGFLGNSYIQLWNEKLSLNQMETLGWNSPPVDLLVLSSCRTALGDREAELGFAGLAVQSGARSALASLWNVDDRGTLGLMSEFYKQLRSANIKAEALRFTQMSMLSGKVRIERGKLLTEGGEFPLPPSLNGVEDTLFSHPYYWSGFTLVGNPW
ncbi:hypothetical protein BCD67_22485 [Oscillatoriales cyanobacterium USR001]|nr:hypothetical protein BCD67_22485 [Oscillatoriales cyanobacterium USR001]